MERISSGTLDHKVFCPLILVLLLRVTSLSQTLPPVVQPTPSPRRLLHLRESSFETLFHDQVAIWTSPFHMSRDEAKFVVPIGVATAALIATNRALADELAENGGSENRLRISRQVSRFGEFHTTGGIAAAFYMASRAKHDYRARETGLLSAEALIDAGIVSSVLKEITQRPRPLVPNPGADFLDKGDSFPSGHATTGNCNRQRISRSQAHPNRSLRTRISGQSVALYWPQSLPF
jgi:hypothetical protein